MKMRAVVIAIVGDIGSWMHHVRALVRKENLSGIDILGFRKESLVKELEKIKDKYDVWVFFQEFNLGIYDFFDQLKGKKYGYLHGGARFEIDDYVPDMAEEREKVTPLYYDGYFCNSEFQRKCFIDLDYPGEKLRVLGFPMDFGRLLVNNVVDNLVMVPGRVDPEKMVPLFGYMLYPLLKDGYRVVFNVPHVREIGEEYNANTVLFLDCMKKRGFEVYYGLSVKDYYEMMSMAKVVVIRGIADTLNTVALEAAAMGKITLAPRIPPYEEFLPDEYLFEPFCQQELLDKVKYQRIIPVPEVWKYDCREVFVRLRNFLEEDNGA